MKQLLLTIFLVLSLGVSAQLSSLEIESQRSEHLSSLKDTAQHVLTEKEIEEFEGLDYFPFDPNYQITAKFIKKRGKRFEMPTSTDRTPLYRRYGFVEFTINDTLCRLEVYQNLELIKKDKYRDYLFIPMRDKTSGQSTYGGGRYLDARIPDEGTMLLDFNLLYNPYCAYSYRYSCPIPPKENKLDVMILAGEKTPIGH